MTLTDKTLKTDASKEPAASPDDNRHVNDTDGYGTDDTRQKSRWRQLMTLNSRTRQ